MSSKSVEKGGSGRPCNPYRANAVQHKWATGPAVPSPPERVDPSANRSDIAANAVALATLPYMPISHLLVHRQRPKNDARQQKQNGSGEQPYCLRLPSWNSAAIGGAADARSRCDTIETTAHRRHLKRTPNPQTRNLHFVVSSRDAGTSRNPSGIGMMSGMSQCRAIDRRGALGPGQGSAGIRQGGSRRGRPATPYPYRAGLSLRPNRAAARFARAPCRAPPVRAGETAPGPRPSAGRRILPGSAAARRRAAAA